MSTRKPASGNRNIVGVRVTEARSSAGMLHKHLLTHLQVAGVEISHPALALLKGQKRPVSDIELKSLAEILNIDVRWLLGQIGNLQRENTCYNSEPAETINGSLFFSGYNLR